MTKTVFRALSKITKVGKIVTGSYMLEDEFVYVVTRDRRRVSHTNHVSRDSAYKESAYWTKLIHTDLGGYKADPKSIIKIVRTNKPNRIK